MEGTVKAKREPGKQAFPVLVSGKSGFITTAIELSLNTRDSDPNCKINCTAFSCEEDDSYKQGIKMHIFWKWPSQNFPLH